MTHYCCVSGCLHKRTKNNKKETFFSLPVNEERNVTLQESPGLAGRFKFVAQVQENFNTKTSSQYILDNLVIIRFIIREDRCRADYIISARKCKEVHSAVNINVTYGSNGTERISGWVCTDADVWSEKYLSRDSLHDKIGDFGFIIRSCYDVNVIVSEKVMIGQSLYEDENFTDFRLSTVDGSVGVHKACLAAHSDMFKAMLNGEWKETVEGRIEVEGASLQTLQALKDFMYLGKLPEEGLQTLLQIAIRFFIDGLKSECIIKLAQNAKPEEYLELQDFARDQQIVDLTLALVELTPEYVITSANGMKQVPEAGNKE